MNTPAAEEQYYDVISSVISGEKGPVEWARFFIAVVGITGGVRENSKKFERTFFPFVKSTGASDPTWAPGRCTDGYEKYNFDRVLMDFHEF